MSWGCKPENYPNGCGWAARAVWTTLALEEWWCETCERAGECPAPPDKKGGAA